MREKEYEVIEHELLYRGIFSLVRYHLRYQLFNGGLSNIITREVLERLSAAAVLPYDPYLDQVVLIEQFRPGALSLNKNPWLIEIVAGCLDKSEAPDHVAYREAEEEANCKITALELISDYYVSPGGSNEYLHLYCGKIDSSLIGGIHGLADEDEDIRAFTISADEAFQKVRQGEIKTAPAIIALQWLQINRQRIQEEWRK